MSMAAAYPAENKEAREGTEQVREADEGGHRDSG
jgi:hypothetical protein